MNLMQLLLIPFSALYGLGVWFRNALYDLGVFRSRSFEIPVISVGNLSVGGTGKTPHIEYLINLLKPKFHLATLSRGYGRQGNQFLLATEEHHANDIGDEPRQFKQKFTDLIVAVDAKRVRGIEQLCTDYPDLQAILLDDAFQHRAVKPGLSILLTEYNRLYMHDRLLPAGRLREQRNGRNRADLIIVTKTPETFSPMERRIVLNELGIKPYQKVFFSYLQYGDFVPFGQKANGKRPNKDFYFERNFSFVVLTGIAHPEPLLDYLENKGAKIKHVPFPDHHVFTKEDLQTVKGIFDTFEGENKLILTTEKDAMRLALPELADQVAELPIFYLPIEVAFHGTDEEEINAHVTDYVGRNKINRSLHPAGE